jgi:hypothetical protein
MQANFNYDSNSNSWSIPVSNAAISLFAASHFVPTLMNRTNDEHLLALSTRQGK